MVWNKLTPPPSQKPNKNENTRRREEGVTILEIPLKKRKEKKCLKFNCDFTGLEKVTHQIFFMHAELENKHTHTLFAAVKVAKSEKHAKTCT